MDNSNVYFQVVCCILLPAVRKAHIPTLKDEMGLQIGVDYSMTAEWPLETGDIKYSAHEYI